MPDERIIIPNNNIDNLQVTLDIIKDAYENYYYIVTQSNSGGRLTAVTLSHSYYEDAFSLVFDEEEYGSKSPYYLKYIGLQLRDRLLQELKFLKEKQRKIFTVSELVNAGVEVSFLDMTDVHSEAKRIKLNQE
jgi:hypothetical protein